MDLVVIQCHVKTAFLNDMLEKTVYIYTEIPNGLEVRITHIKHLTQHYARKLQKFLYRLKVSKMVCTKFRDAMKIKKFEGNPSFSTMYLHMAV